MLKNLDIHTAVQTAFLLAILGVVLSLWVGFRAIRSGYRLPYFRKRNDRIWQGYRMVLFAFFLVLAAFSINRYAEPTAYRFFPPSATITNTPTITLTPTITQTPTITLTPTITKTPSITDTPFLPVELATKIQTTITPNAKAVISPLAFAKKINEKTLLPEDPATEFANPIAHMYATFTYDGMVAGSQWSAVWYRDGVLVYDESKPWDGGTGGYGYSDWEPSLSEWLPGTYEVQIFVGLEWKISGRFTVTGAPPAGAPAPKASRTPAPAVVGTPTVIRTHAPSVTPTFTRTHMPSFTPTISLTPTITLTPWPSVTPRPTDTHQPTPTNTATKVPK